LANARQALGLVLDRAGTGTADLLALERACKLANFLTQAFFCAEPWTKRPGSHVSLAESSEPALKYSTAFTTNYPPRLSILRRD
jgi:F0F1-type ATP synthase beta subunit